MLTIRHKAVECIGCVACVEIAPHYWQLNEDGLAKLVHKTGERAPFDLGEGFIDDEAILREAEDNCPVNIIEIQSR